MDVSAEARVHQHEECHHRWGRQEKLTIFILTERRRDACCLGILPRRAVNGSFRENFGTYLVQRRRKKGGGGSRLRCTCVVLNRDGSK